MSDVDDIYFIEEACPKCKHYQMVHRECRECGGEGVTAPGEPEPETKP